MSACGNLAGRSLASTTNDALESNDSTSQKIISTSGIIHFNDAEGGHFVIWADDGNTYLPTALAKELQVDGLKVIFTGSIARDAFMNGMSGYILNIESIEVAE
jgi:hypothetical protein